MFLAQVVRLFKTFIVGVILGLAAAAAAAFVLPVADLHRESSLISVLPNGGNSEVFRIRVPDDRLLGGGAGVATPTPASLRWPDALSGKPLQMEVFKLRNRDGVVVGVASRISVAAEGGQAPALEWVLHLPARGTLFFPITSVADAAGFRSGQLRAGSGEFLRRTGSLREQFSAGSDGSQIELLTSLRGEQEAMPGVQP